MKHIIYNSILALSALLTLAACQNKQQPVKEKEVSAVSTVYAPADGKSVVLQSSSSAALSFEWAPALSSDGGLVQYEVLFDKDGGDFSDPVYSVSSNSNGAANIATIPHKVLNAAAAAAGAESAQKITLQWTVRSSMGWNGKLSSEVRKLTVTCLAGFADVPEKVYVSGAASEGGADLVKAMPFQGKDGEFEIYTKLLAGKDYYFVSDNQGSPRQFSLKGDKLIENGTCKVSADGVYNIKLDFNTSSYVLTRITRIGFFFSPSNAILFDLDYKGAGIFQKKATVTFKQEGWGRDQRYKFRIFMKANGGADAEKEYELATLNGTDSAPTESSDASYYYTKIITSLTQWDNKWKLMSKFDGVEATYSVIFSADGPYTHSVEL